MKAIARGGFEIRYRKISCWGKGERISPLIKDQLLSSSQMRTPQKQTNKHSPRGHQKAWNRLPAICDIVLCGSCTSSKLSSVVSLSSAQAVSPGGQVTGGLGRKANQSWCFFCSAQKCLYDLRAWGPTPAEPLIRSKERQKDGFSAPSLAFGSSNTSWYMRGISKAGLEHPYCLSKELTWQPCGQVELQDGWILRFKWGVLMGIR